MIFILNNDESDEVIFENLLKVKKFDHNLLWEFGVDLHLVCWTI